MALQFYDGFDHYATVNDMLSRTGMLQYTATTGSFVTGRNGNGKELSGSFNASLGQRVAEAGMGASMFCGSGDIVINLMDLVANSVQVQVVLRQRNFSIEVYRGSTLILLTANNVFGEGQNFVEVWAKIDASVGYVKVIVNQQTLVNITAANTQNSANAWWDGLQVSSASIDDLYYADATTGDGTHPCNAPLGDPRVYTQYPNANAAVQFTPLANANWQEVSETAFDGDVSYNFSQTPGQEDLFTITPTPSTITAILGVQITGAYRKDDAGLRKIKNALKSSATEVYGTAMALADTSYQWRTDLFVQDPNGSTDWARAAVNASQIGYNLAA